MIKQIAVPRRLSPAEDYLRLVRRFPLRPLRNQKEYDIAASILDELVLRDNLSKGEADYLDALSTFVESYDDKHFPVEPEHLKPLDMLRFLMEQTDMSSAGLAKLLGSRSAASMILSGKRAMSKTHIRKLATRFKLDANVFL
jgi:HTH-type transcriptional regulator / antitoxin HigA